MYSDDAAARKVSYLGLLALVDPYKSWQARIASEHFLFDLITFNFAMWK
jgi:hypothetical protein